MFLKREIVLWTGATQALIAALRGFEVVTWNGQQTALVMGFVAAFLALLARSQVSPKAHDEERRNR